jgi:hypothetical protein
MKALGGTQLVVKYEVDAFRRHHNQARKVDPLSRISPHSTLWFTVFKLGNRLILLSTIEAAIGCHIDHVTTNLPSPTFPHEASLCPTPNSRFTWLYLG